MEPRTWQIEVYLYEDGSRTWAEAVLNTEDGTTLRYDTVTGHDPVPPGPVQPGDGAVVSRVLYGLTDRLITATVASMAVRRRGPREPDGQQPAA